MNWRQGQNILMAAAILALLLLVLPLTLSGYATYNDWEANGWRSCTKPSATCSCCSSSRIWR